MTKIITEIGPCQILPHMLFKLSFQNEWMSQISPPGSAPAYLLRHLPQQRYKPLSDLAYRAYQHHSYSQRKRTWSSNHQIGNYGKGERESPSKSSSSISISSSISSSDPSVTGAAPFCRREKGHYNYSFIINQAKFVRRVSIAFFTAMLLTPDCEEYKFHPQCERRGRGTIRI